jgi:hypothetical protein
MVTTLSGAAREILALASSAAAASRQQRVGGILLGGEGAADFPDRADDQEDLPG